MENKEKTYPIYRFTARWSEISKNKSYEEYPNWKKGLPEDRIWNSAIWTKMYREEQDLIELEGWMMQWWDEYLTKKDNEDKKMKLFCLKVELVEKETWHLTWFQHETFDEGQSDEEVLRSFENYVRRKELLNNKLREEGKDEYCLMGAEDRWRWHGAEPNGKPSYNNYPAPCRCKYCKEQGMIRICH